MIPSTSSFHPIAFALMLSSILSSNMMSMAFTIPSSTSSALIQPRYQQSLQLSVAIDPNDLIHPTNTILDSTTSITTALGGGEWSFLWFHAGAPDPYNTGLSLPPIDSTTTSTTASAIKDYFLPTASDEVMQKTIQQATSSSINSADFIQYDTVMPGAKLPSNIPTPPPPISNEISVREIEWIARTTDLMTRKIPAAVTVYALLDFFVLPNQQDLYVEELQEDRMGIMKEWMTGTSVRLGALFGVVVLTIFCENVFNHPV